MVNDPQDDLLELIRQEFKKAVKEKRSAIHIEDADNPRDDTFKLCVVVDGHDLWCKGLNKDHDMGSCDRCNPPKPIVEKQIVKSIYHQDDLSCNDVGNDIEYEAKKFFQSMLDKYPDHNPREMVEICAGAFHLMACRHILELRRAGVLKKE